MNQIDASYRQVFGTHIIGRDLLPLPGNLAPLLQEPAPGNEHSPEHLPSPDFDGVWKEALRLWLPQCLELFWPHVHAQVNWTTGPVFLDKELKQLGRLVKQGTRHVDVLARLTLLSGQKALLLVHLEVQGGAIGPSFPERMLRYHVRIRERHPGQALNRTGNRGGCLVKVKQVPQPVLQVVDSIALRLRPAGYHRSSPASAGG